MERIISTYSACRTVSEGGNRETCEKFAQKSFFRLKGVPEKHILSYFPYDYMELFSLVFR